MKLIISKFKYCIYLLFVIFIATKPSYSQERLSYYVYKPIAFSIVKSSKKGYDKSGRKSGEWEEICGFKCPLFFKDSTVIIESSFGIGYYVDGLKQGMWDVYDKKDYDTRKLIAQIFFDKGMIVFQLTYVDNVIDNFTRLACVRKPTNKGVTEDVICIDKIYFDDNKNIFRESYSPNGVLSKYQYPPKP